MFTARKPVYPPNHPLSKSKVKGNMHPRKPFVPPPQKPFDIRGVRRAHVQVHNENKPEYDGPLNFNPATGQPYTTPRVPERNAAPGQPNPPKMRFLPGTPPNVLRLRQQQAERERKAAPPAPPPPPPATPKPEPKPTETDDEPEEELIGRQLANQLVKELVDKGLDETDRHLLNCLAEMTMRADVREAYHEGVEACERAAALQPERERQMRLTRLAAQKREELAEMRKRKEEERMAREAEERKAYEEAEQKRFAQRRLAEQARRREMQEKARIQAVAAEMRRLDAERQRKLAAEADAQRRLREAADAELIRRRQEERRELERKAGQAEAARRAQVAAEAALREQMEREAAWRAEVEQQRIELEALRKATREANEYLARERAAREVQERQLREIEERVRREAHAKEQQERSAQEARAREQEARERAAREAQEKAYREEQERLAREQAENEASRAVAHSNLYDAKWLELKTNCDLKNRIGYHHFPFPMFADPENAPAPSEVTYEKVAQFVMSPYRVSMEGKTAKERVKIEVLRWHPDKFDGLLSRMVVEQDREKTKEAAGLVARWLTRMMAEV